MAWQGCFSCSEGLNPIVTCLPTYIWLFIVVRLWNNGEAIPIEGRVEVLYKGNWGGICADTFDIIDADVICKTIGFSSEHLL